MANRPPRPAPSLEGGGGPWTLRGTRGVGALLAAWMVLAVLLALARPGAAWGLHFASPPAPGALAWTALYLLLALAFRPGRGGALRNALLTATLLGYHLGYEVALHGDYDQWTLLSTQRVASLGEPLASAVYYLVQHALGPTALPLVPPVVGAITTWTYLAVSDRLFRGPQGPSASAARAAAIAWLAWGGQVAFFSNAIENTQLSLPLVLLFVLALVRMVEARGHGPAPVAALARCGALLGASGLFHGQAWFLAPALVLALLLDARPGLDGHLARRALRAAGALGLALAVYGAGLAVLGALGFRIVAGNALGGGDAWPFVPLLHAEGPFDRYVLLSAAHGRELGSVLLFSGALVPLWLASALTRARSARRSVLALVALAEAAFLSLYQFDLGFPGDLDLMTSQTVVLVLWSLDRALASGLRPPALFAACAAGLVLSGGVLWSMLQPRPSDAPVALFVEGVRARPGTPLDLEPGPRGALSFEVHGPPGALCTLLTGPTVPGGYKASVAAEPLHVALTDGELRTLFTGRLDGEGRARGTLSAGELDATGEGALLQALVVREAPGAHACQATGALRVLGGGSEGR